MKHSFRIFVLIALAAFFVKLLAVCYSYPGCCPGGDIYTIIIRANATAAHGLRSLYPGTDQYPIYFYVLWLVGKLVAWTSAAGWGLGDVQRTIIVTPPLVADFAVSLLIFKLIEGLHGLMWAWICGLGFMLNPACLLDTVVWQQIDSFHVMFMVASLLLLVRGWPAASWTALALGTLSKPLAFSLFPVILVWTILHYSWGTWIKAGLCAAVVSIATCLPFFWGKSLGVIYFTFTWPTLTEYPLTSMNAFNAMALIFGNKVQIEPMMKAVGTGLLLVVYVWCGWRLVRRRDEHALMVAAFVTVFGFFIFCPAMHERYIYAPAVFGLLVMAEGPEWTAIGLMMTICATANIMLLSQWHRYDIAQQVPRDFQVMVLSAANTVLFLWAMTAGGLQQNESSSQYRPSISG